uniref:Myotubularin phosphatase domain-containing protein n=1 Tax=Parascaris equorum TaxID=6256 RepID=A0A914RJW0_PAREQ
LSRLIFEENFFYQVFFDAFSETFIDELKKSQCPSAFEFNDFFLRFLAYHSSSACFRTFVLDSECERITFDTLCISACDPRIADSLGGRAELNVEQCSTCLISKESFWTPNFDFRCGRRDV